MTTRLSLLSSAAFLLAASAANAQETAPPAPADQQQPQASTDSADIADDGQFEGQSVVVNGTKLRGSAIGDIPPEDTLTSRDVQATGATDINELLDALSPQIGSARGRGGERPVMLLNGERISSFREIRDIPTEAISRVEILPEEVALKYGYSADQKVVNIVLRPRFRSTTALASGKAATEGGYFGVAADTTRLAISKTGRTTVNLHAEGNGMLTENERHIVVEAPPEGVDVGQAQAARSLIGTKRDLRGTVTVNRQLGTIGATGNIELEHNEGRSLIGLGETLLQPLGRQTQSDTAHAGGVLEGSLSSWRWMVTANADAAHALTRTDVDSAGPRDRASTTTLSADVLATAHGNLLTLPAGAASATLKAGASTTHQQTDRRRNGVDGTNSVSRSTASAGFNIDLPVSRRNSDFAPLGNLSLNANGEVRELSDFGTLTTIGAGAHWSPIERLDLIGSWTREEGAPTIHQLGDPVLETPDTRIFDFTTGETVLSTAITGGNPALDSDRRSVVKLGANWKPFAKPDLRIRGEYVRSVIDHPISNFPGPTPSLEAAFPDRFIRDSDGNLVAIDLRPVNYDQSRRETVRIGFDFSKPLKSAAPSAEARAAFRARRQQASESTSPDGPSAATGRAERGGQTPGQAEQAGPAAQEGAARGVGRGRFGANRNRGRIRFSLADTVTLVDQVTIRDGLMLDYLHGDAIGQSGGRPRHEVEARASYFNNGLGAHVSANWRSATRVTSAGGDDLRFSPLATFDLRLWANLGQKYDLVAKHPWLRGSSVRFEVDNIFNSKPSVRDPFGAAPIGYQPDLLDPLGRTVTITFRKLFLPPRSFFRRDRSGGEEG